MEICLKSKSKNKMAKFGVRQVFCCKKTNESKPNSKQNKSKKVEQLSIDDVAETKQQLQVVESEQKTEKQVVLENQNSESEDSQLQTDEESEISVEMQQPTDREQINDAGQQVAKAKSRKKKLMTIGGFILNIVIVVGILWYQLANEEVASPDYLLSQGGRLWYILLIFFCFFVVMGLDAYRTNIFIKKSGNRSRPGLAYKVCSIGKYYDAVTPLSTGGQPFQIFYLNNRGLGASAALSVPMARYVASQMGWMICSVVSVLCVALFNLAEGSVISIASYIGFALNFTILTFTLVLSLSKKIGKKLVVKGLKLLQKMRIVKNYEKQYERVMNVVSGYQTTMSEYAKSIGTFLLIILVSILYYIVNYSIPFFIYLMFGGTDVSMWPKMMALTAMIELASSFIPLPGGTGMNELSFTVMFAPYFTGGTIFWALLIWRLMSYYMYLIQGISIIVYDYALGNRKYDWQKRKWELEAESLLFKEQQLKNYKRKKKESQSK